MELGISIGDDLKKLDMKLKETRVKVIKAARRAINRTAKSTRAYSATQLKQKRKVKASELKKRIAILKGKGGTRSATRDLKKMETVVAFSDKPLPLIWFVVGSKKPRRVTKRSKPLRIQVVQGQKIPRKGLYIARAKRGKYPYQVFRRVNTKKRAEGMVKQSASSLSELLRADQGLLSRITKRTGVTLRKEFKRELTYQLRS